MKELKRLKEEPKKSRLSICMNGLKMEKREVKVDAEFKKNLKFAF